MDLPKSIQEQLDAAAEIEKQLTQPETPPPEPTDTEPEVTETAPPDPEVVTQSEPTSEQKPQVPEETWQRRFETLAGKYEAETPRLHQQIRELQLQLEAQTKVLTEMQTRPEPAPEPAKSLVTKDDEETFGSDLIDLSRRVVREEFNAIVPSVISELRKEFAPIREQVGEVQRKAAQSDEERFWGALDSAVPDWRDIDKRDDWLGWLNEVDPLTGKPRQDSLNAAHSSLDANRVVAIFNVWRSQFAPKQPETPVVQSKREELKRQVAPARTSGNAAAPKTERTWTGEEYQRAFDPRLTATMSNADIEKLQAEADKAYAEGRVEW